MVCSLHLTLDKNKTGTSLIRIFSRINLKMNTRPVVFVTRCVPPNGMDMLKAECEVRAWPNDAAIPRDQLLQGVKGADGLLCHPSERIDQEALDAAGIYKTLVVLFTARRQHH